MRGASKRAKIDEHTTELERLMRSCEERWQGDVIGFIDAISRIPVLILLRAEKKQLEFLRMNGSLTQHPTIDITERRLSEVTSLIEHDSPSLFEMKGDETSDGHDVEAMEIITKHCIERRKKALRAKIERLRNGESERHSVDQPQQNSDKCCDEDVNIDESAAIQPMFQHRVSDITDVDDGKELQRRGCTIHEDVAVEQAKNRRVRRRKSVITKMNEAIHRK